MNNPGLADVFVSNAGEINIQYGSGRDFQIASTQKTAKAYILRFCDFFELFTSGVRAFQFQGYA
jgi:hypothetical protein